MILDLTGLVPLKCDVLRRLNRIAVEAKTDYNSLIEKFSSIHGENIDWWVTPAASRSIFTSKLFKYCCYVRLVRELLCEKECQLEKIVVDSKILLNILRQVTDSENKKIVIEVSQVACAVCVSLKNIVRIIFHLLLPKICAIIYRKHNDLSSDGVILVDTFIYQFSFESGGFDDRHYPDLNKYLSEEERKRIVYVPTFYKVKNYFSIFKSICSSNSNFFVKENYLNIVDYFYALSHGRRVRKLLHNRHVFDEIDFTEAFHSEIRSSAFSLSSLYAILNYRLIKRLSEQKINITRVVDWFENHSIDRGLNTAVRRYYPDIPVVGYIGYAPPSLYLCAYPTRQEYLNKVIPNKIAVMGAGWVDTIKQFCPELNVEEAPAFRFMKKRAPTVGGAKGILIALPKMLDEAVSILELVLDMLEVNDTGDGVCVHHIDFVIKPHPVTSEYELKDRLSKRLPENISFTKKPFDELVGAAKILVSSTSSVCMETIAFGVPVIIIANQYGITQTSIPQDVSKKIWLLCYTSRELLIAINQLVLVRDEKLNDLAEKIKTQYFSPVSNESTRIFLGLR